MPNQSSARTRRQKEEVEDDSTAKPNAAHEPSVAKGVKKQPDTKMNATTVKRMPHQLSTRTHRQKAEEEDDSIAKPNTACHPARLKCAMVRSEQKWTEKGKNIYYVQCHDNRVSYIISFDYRFQAFHPYHEP